MFNIIDGFTCLCNDSILLSKAKSITCKKCNKIQEHKESKKFYHTARDLIIFFDRGENSNNNLFIDFDEQLILNSYYVERYKLVQYQLVGIIEKVENHNKSQYISLTKINNDQWAYNKEKIFNFKEAKKLGIVIALFYYSPNDYMTLQPDYNNNINVNNINPLFNNSGNFGFQHQMSENIVDNNRMVISTGNNDFMNNNVRSSSYDKVNPIMNNNIGMNMNNQGMNIRNEYK